MYAIACGTPPDATPSPSPREHADAGVSGAMLCRAQWCGDEEGRIVNSGTFRAHSKTAFLGFVLQSSRRVSPHPPATMPDTGDQIATAFATKLAGLNATSQVRVLTRGTPKPARLHPQSKSRTKCPS